MRQERQLVSVPPDDMELRRQAAVRGMREGQNWLDFANCKGDPEAFTYADDKPGNETYLKAAEGMCRSCVVVEQCLVHALAGKDKDMFQAGLTAQKLGAMARRIKRQKASNQRAS